MDCNIFIIEFYNKEGDKKTPSPHEWGVRGVESVADTFLWHNKQIIFTWNEIIYRSIFGIEKKYSWEDVKTVCYKSIGRGANRILIQTDKKIYIETGMMKKCEDVERVIKEKGYLRVKIK